MQSAHFMSTLDAQQSFLFFFLVLLFRVFGCSDEVNCEARTAEAAAAAVLVRLLRGSFGERVRRCCRGFWAATVMVGELASACLLYWPGRLCCSILPKAPKARFGLPLADGYPVSIPRACNAFAHTVPRTNARCASLSTA